MGVVLSYKYGVAIGDNFTCVVLMYRFDCYWVRVSLSEIRGNGQGLFVLENNSCFSERLVRLLEFKENKLQTGNDISWNVLRALNDCVYHVLLLLGLAEFLKLCRNAICHKSKDLFVDIEK